jgi:hypothetical protein
MIDAEYFHFDQNRSRLGHWIRQILYHQAIKPTEMLNTDCSHNEYPTLSEASRSSHCVPTSKFHCLRPFNKELRIEEGRTDICPRSRTRGFSFRRIPSPRSECEPPIIRRFRRPMKRYALERRDRIAVRDFGLNDFPPSPGVCCLRLQAWKRTKNAKQIVRK